MGLWWNSQDDVCFSLLAPFYVDLVHCLLAFSANAVDRIAQDAVDHVARLGSHLAFGHVPIDDGSEVLPLAAWSRAHVTQRYGHDIALGKVAVV